MERHVLHFRPTRWDRWAQELEVVSGELLPDQPVPLLEKRLEMSRVEAIQLWKERGWPGRGPQALWRTLSPPWIPHSPERWWPGWSQAGGTVRAASAEA